MGQCMEKKKREVHSKSSISNDLIEATNYAIVDKNMLPKDLVGKIQNPTYVANDQQYQVKDRKTEKPKTSMSLRTADRKNNLSKDRYNSVYNYIDYDYEVVFSNNKYNKDKNNNDLNNYNRNKNIYKTISLDTSESSSNNTANDNENLIDEATLSKRNLNTCSAKKLLGSNSIVIEITSL